MAKRKAAGTARRKVARKGGGASRRRAAAHKNTGRRSAAKKAGRKKTGRAVLKRATRTSARKPAARRAVAKKAAPRAVAKKRSVGQTSSVRKASSKARSAAATRKVPALNRARRMVQGDDIVPSPPSSLNMDRTASAVRTGRREMRERIDEHTETSPALTAGDVDADWESAYSVGDEAPGGDNPTPDQDIVDDIGKAVGVQYDDNEELKGEAKITKRDKHRWELDPASSEDYDDR